VTRKPKPPIFFGVKAGKKGKENKKGEKTTKGGGKIREKGGRGEAHEKEDGKKVVPETTAVSEGGMM